MQYEMTHAGDAPGASCYAPGVPCVRRTSRMGLLPLQRGRAASAEWQHILARVGLSLLCVRFLVPTHVCVERISEEQQRHSAIPIRLVDVGRYLFTHRLPVQERVAISTTVVPHVYIFLSAWEAASRAAA